MRANKEDTGGSSSSRGRNDVCGRLKAACELSRMTRNILQRVPSDNRVHEREAEEAVGNHGAKAKIDERSLTRTSGETPPGSSVLGRQDLRHDGKTEDESGEVEGFGYCRGQ